MSERKVMDALEVVGVIGAAASFPRTVPDEQGARDALARERIEQVENLLDVAKGRLSSDDEGGGTAEGERRDFMVARGGRRYGKRLVSGHGDNPDPYFPGDLADCVFEIPY